jgi:acrylyl-CoA reductase (NADPH)
MASLAVRCQAWERLARDIDASALAAMTEVVPLTAAIAKAHTLMEGQVRGRVAVTI